MRNLGPWEQLDSYRLSRSWREAGPGTSIWQAGRLGRLPAPPLLSIEERSSGLLLISPPPPHSHGDVSALPSLYSVLFWKALQIKNGVGFGCWMVFLFVNILCSLCIHLSEGTATHSTRNRKSFSALLSLTACTSATHQPCKSYLSRCLSDSWLTPTPFQTTVVSHQHFIIC